MTRDHQLLFESLDAVTQIGKLIAKSADAQEFALHASFVRPGNRDVPQWQRDRQQLVVASFFN